MVVVGPTPQESKTRDAGPGRKGLVQIAKRFHSGARAEEKAPETLAHHNKTAPLSRKRRPACREREAQRQPREKSGEKKMASSSSSPRLSRLLLPVILVVAGVVLLGGRGGEARQPPPLHGVRPMAFDEGYTQIFGSANLALHGEGKRVHLSLDESTGEYRTTRLHGSIYLCYFGVSRGCALRFFYIANRSLSCSSVGSGRMVLRF